MRRLLLLPSLSLLAAGATSWSSHAQPYPGYYPPPQPPPYAGRPVPYGGGPGPGAENCGTPDQWKPCPPLPRVPLPYYPANR